MNDTDWELFARCGAGFEPVLATELKSFGMVRVRPLQGGVAFVGGLEAAYTACVWSRIATRIQLVLGRVAAHDADALYAAAHEVAWERLVRDGATVAVDAHGTNPELRNTAFTALKVKDALCDRLRGLRGTRPDVDAKHPDFWVNVALHANKATLYLNLSGPSLHRRGYRKDGEATEAPLKETLAAGILFAVGWQDLAESGGVMADPLCGSGTLGIEAALVAARKAPGLMRQGWGFAGWLGHDPDLWQRVCAHARAQELPAPATPPILMGDKDSEAVRIARGNVDRAGLARWVRLYEGDAARIEVPLKRWRALRGASALMATNPPYGQRLLAGENLRAVYDALDVSAEALARRAASCTLAVITPDAGIDSALGRTPRATLACNNGPIDTWVRSYDLADDRKLLGLVSLAGKQREIAVADKRSEMFCARLRKTARDGLRSARRSGEACLRVYDADIPEYPFRVDIWRVAAADDTGKSYGEELLACVSQLRRARAKDAVAMAQRFADASAVVAAVLDLPNERVRVRAAEEGTRRRGMPHQTEERLHIRENGIAHTVSADWPAGDLPVEERLFRREVASLCAHRRVAALCASPALLACASAAQSCERVQIADLEAWLAHKKKSGHLLDVVVATPPEWVGSQQLAKAARTRSRTKGARAKRKAWELARELYGLLASLARILAPQGRILLAFDATVGELDTLRLADAGLTLMVNPREFVSSDCVRSHDLVRMYELGHSQLQ